MPSALRARNRRRCSRKFSRGRADCERHFAVCRLTNRTFSYFTAKIRRRREKFLNLSEAKSYGLLCDSRLVGYPSGQRGQTVNLLAYAFDGSNPSPTTTLFLQEKSGF